jgi:hypothetical protein
MARRIRRLAYRTRSARLDPLQSAREQHAREVDQRVGDLGPQAKSLGLFVAIQALIGSILRK